MIKRVAAALLVAGFCLSTTACIGRMAVSAEVRKFNLQVVENKWAREGVFLLLYFIPVYPFAGAIDLLIVNSIEFHTGTNPLSGEARLARAGDSYRSEAPDGTVSVSTLREDGSIDFVVTEPDGSAHFVNVGQQGERVVARDARGAELGSVPAGAGALTLSAAR